MRKYNLIYPSLFTLHFQLKTILETFWTFHEGIAKKLLGKIDEEENEEGEEQKVLGFIKKFREVKKRVSLFWSDNIFIRIKKYSILSIIGFFLCSPIINGVFGYGYYVFYESDVYRCFQIELILCFVFGFILILLTEE